MKILVEHGGYGLRNHGDTAMLQVALARFSEMWPGAHVSFFAGFDADSDLHCPGAHPIPFVGRDMLCSPGTLTAPLNRIVPGLEKLEDRMRLQAPGLTAGLVGIRKRALGKDSSTIHQFLRTLSEADLVVAAGGGYLTDQFPEVVMNLHQTFALAKKLGKVTALLGQGLGPFEKADIRKLASEVLGSADIICLREKLVGPRILRDMGVPEDRMVVTGDDAIEMAYLAAKPTPGAGLGVNVRLAAYSKLNEASLEPLRAILQQASQALNAPFIPAPISFWNQNEDSTSIAKILQGAQGSFEELLLPRTPAELIANISGCRIMVTGSYHSAVFALAQGIPAIALYGSSYYRDKFLGLADQFGPGLKTVELDGTPDWEKKLPGLIEATWAAADNLRPSLLEAAERQVRASKGAYNRLLEISSLRQGTLAA